MLNRIVLLYRTLQTSFGIRKCLVRNNPTVHVDFHRSSNFPQGRCNDHEVPHKTNPVYGRRVNSFVLVSSHRHFFIPLIFGSRFIDS
jgi:hypothetical protein